MKGNRILGILHAAVMCTALLLLVILLVWEMKNTGSYYRMAIYALLIIWAGVRVYSLLKNILCSQ